MKKYVGGNNLLCFIFSYLAYPWDVVAKDYPDSTEQIMKNRSAVVNQHTRYWISRVEFSLLQSIFVFHYLSLLISPKNFAL